MGDRLVPRRRPRFLVDPDVPRPGRRRLPGGWKLFALYRLGQDCSRDEETPTKSETTNSIRPIGESKTMPQSRYPPAVRVLLAHNRYRTSGGEERHVDLLAEWLTRVGGGGRPPRGREPGRRRPRRAHAAGADPHYRPEGAALVRQAIAREKPDVVHFHNIVRLSPMPRLRRGPPAGFRWTRVSRLPLRVSQRESVFAQARIHDDCIDGSSLLSGLRNPETHGARASPRAG